MSHADRQIHLVREVRIQGTAAQALQLINDKRARQELEDLGVAGVHRRQKLQAMVVRDERDAVIALADRENEQHCPLCNEFFDTESFIAHGPQCATARAPRRRFWTPAGFSQNAIAAFKDKVRMI